MDKYCASKKVMALVLLTRGGIGKSFTSQMVTTTLQSLDLTTSVRKIDSDRGNSSFAQVYPDARFAPIRSADDVDAIGEGLLAIQDLANSTVDHCVWDHAAGTVSQIQELVLPRLVVNAKKNKINLVMFHPITTSQYTQDEAIEFAAWARQAGTSTVFVRNLGQGRKSDHFKEWDALQARKSAMPPAVEVVLPDAGAWIAEEAASLRLSLTDVAAGRFDRLPEKAAEIAKRKFSAPVRLAVSDYLEQVCSAFGAAIDEAIANTKIQK